jgi:hypothetical protein
MSIGQVLGTLSFVGYLYVAGKDLRLFGGRRSADKDSRTSVE